MPLVLWCVMRLNVPLVRSNFSCAHLPNAKLGVRSSTQEYQCRNSPLLTASELQKTYVSLSVWDICFLHVTKTATMCNMLTGYGCSQIWITTLFVNSNAAYGCLILYNGRENYNKENTRKISFSSFPPTSYYYTLFIVFSWNLFHGRWLPCKYK